MQNTISLQDWFNFIDREYLSTYVRAGGSSVKFAVTPEELKADLYATVESRCKALDYEVIKLDAKNRDMRAYMPQDIFFGLARQIDWRLLARRFILRLAAQRGFRVDGIDITPPGVFDRIAESNGIEPIDVIREIRPEIQNSIARNGFMAKDFRVCMSHLCLLEYIREDYNGLPLLEWLQGINTRISNVRPFSIYSSINRATARYFIESALYWVRYAGCAGTVILLDNFPGDRGPQPQGRVEVLHPCHDVGALSAVARVCRSGGPVEKRPLAGGDQPRIPGRERRTEFEGLRHIRCPEDSRDGRRSRPEQG